MSDPPTTNHEITGTLTAIRPARRARAPRALIVGLVVLLWLLPVAGTGVWLTIRGKVHSTRSAASTSASGLSHDTRTTTPGFAAFAQGQQTYMVDPRFAAYYRDHAGASLLGQPVTPAYPTGGSIVQFFAAGALLLPNPDATAAQSRGGFGDATNPLFRDGQYDPASGVLRLPLLHALLTTGSLAPLAGDDASLTYADLRAAILPIALDPGASSDDAVNQKGLPPEPSFVYADAKSSRHSGRIIPQPIWTYLNRSDVAPDGWMDDYGLPLTLPLPLTVTRGGNEYHVLVQAFWRGALLEDVDDASASGTRPAVGPLPTGVGYLETLGPPTVALPASGHVWATGDLAIATSPGASARAHVGANFPFTLRGDFQWANAALWYHVSWAAGHAGNDGWVPAGGVTSVAPPKGAFGSASFDVLSPSLAAYLNGWGNSLGVVVYDVTRQQYYTYNPNGAFTVGSSIKVPILLAVLQMTESQGRAPTSDEMYLLTTMIENSDNDAAETLFLEIGGFGPIQALLDSLHIGGLEPNYDNWGYSQLSPMAMVKLLAALHDGKILTASDRALALNLMENVESDQRLGVGDTAPRGATVAMKDGWVVGTDGYWGINSSGIVTVGHETYIISVYSRQDSYDWSFAEQVCGQVAKLLT